MQSQATSMEAYTQTSKWGNCKRERPEVAFASCAKARRMGSYASSAAGSELQRLTQFLAFDAKIVYIFTLPENNKRHPRRKIAKPSQSLEKEKKSFNVNHPFQIGSPDLYEFHDPARISMGGVVVYYMNISVA